MVKFETRNPTVEETLSRIKLNFSKDLRKVRAFAMRLSRQRMFPAVGKQPVQRP